LHQFEQARIVDRNPDDPDRPTNSGNTVYALTKAALQVIQAYDTGNWKTSVVSFLRKVGGLQKQYSQQRDMHKIPLKLPNGKMFLLSPGSHNELQAAIIKEFAPRFAGGAILVYFGDTSRKQLFLEKDLMKQLRVPITEHDKLPDLVLYLKSKNWLFLIEAVTTHGPFSPKRQKEIEQMLRNCKAERVYVTAFPDRPTFKKYAHDLAWETEAWIASDPDHMIHFNGDKFLGPHKK